MKEEHALLTMKFTDDGEFLSVKAEPNIGYAKAPFPVLWDRKKEVNVKDYHVIDWANKMHEEVNEAHQCGSIAGYLKTLLDGEFAAGEATKAFYNILRHDYKVWDEMENRELFDVLTTVVSRLADKGIKPGSEKWNKYVAEVNRKNAERGAFFEHPKEDVDGTD